VLNTKRVKQTQVCPYLQTSKYKRFHHQPIGTSRFRFFSVVWLDP